VEHISPKAWDFVVRPAKAGDASAMLQLARVAYEGYVGAIGREPAPMNADYIAAVSLGHAWVAERSGQVIGLLVLEPFDRYLLVENLAVAPDDQGAGIGGQLLELAEREARSLGLPEVRLYTNEAMKANLSFYLRRGYRETHRALHDGYRRVFFAKAVDIADAEYTNGSSPSWPARE
jgi:N-acetylglutamate synthase-like GNAT family acetyltransferase